MIALREGNQRVSISTGVVVETRYWDKEYQRVIKKHPDYRFINEKIALADKAAKVAGMYGELDGLTLKEIANRFRREMGMEEKVIKENTNSFLDFYNMWAHTSFGKHTATKNTSYHYKLMKNYIGRANPSFDEIDYNFYIKFVSHMEKNGYKTNTIGSHVRDLKAAMNEAFKRGLHTNIAYQRFEKPVEQVTTVALTKEEVDRLYNTELVDGMEKARDLFLLGCYTGLRFSDYSRLTLEEGEREFITKIQQKTKREVSVPVHPRVRAILRKWNGAPVITEQKMNSYIKLICEKVGINEKIEVRDGGKITYKKKWEMVSSHTARRTAATNLLLSGASIYEVMHFLGHSTVTQTQVYLRISSKENAKILAKNKFFSEE